MATLAELNAPSPDVWESGARSVAQYEEAECWFGFELPIDSEASVVGLNSNDLGQDYREIQFGYEFRGQSFRIMESGQPKGAWLPHYGGARYYVMRRPDRSILYVLRPAGTAFSATFTDNAYPGVLLPGVVLLAGGPSYGAVFLDSAFFQEGDAITTASSGEGEWLGLGLEEPTGMTTAMSGKLPLAGRISSFSGGIMDGQLKLKGSVHATFTAELHGVLPLAGLASSYSNGLLMGKLPLHGEAHDDPSIRLQYDVISGYLPLPGSGYSVKIWNGANGQLPLRGVISAFSGGILTGFFDVTQGVMIGKPPNRFDILIALDGTANMSETVSETAVIVSHTSEFIYSSTITWAREKAVIRNPPPVLAIGRSDVGGTHPDGTYPPGTVVIYYDVLDSVEAETHALPVLTSVVNIRERAVIRNPEPFAYKVKRETVTETAVLNDAATARVGANLGGIGVDPGDGDFDGNGDWAGPGTGPETHPPPLGANTTVYAQQYDLGFLNDIATTKLTVVVIVHEKFRAASGSGAAFAVSERVTESAVITSKVTETARLIADARETAVITSLVTDGNHSYVLVTETAVITSTALPKLTLIATSHEHAWLTSYVYAYGGALSMVDPDDVPFEATDAWTANVVSWAMSRLDHSAAAISGFAGLYASSPAGLFGPSEKYADFIAKTGAAEFGTATLKTIPSVYTYGTHVEPMTITVTADLGGIKASYEYVQMARDSSDYRGIRTDFGRGLRSTYFQLTFKATGYADILFCEPIVKALQRRI